MKLLITGGAGYIGSVVAANWSMPTTKSWPSTTFRREASGRFPRVRGWFTDLVDVEILNSTLSEGFDGVLHLATLSLVGESVEHPGLYYRTNVCGTLNLLDAMRAARVSRLIFSSTAAVYGQPEEVPVEETTPTRPTNPYRSSKPAADAMIGYEAAAGLAGSTTRTPRS